MMIFTDGAERADDDDLLMIDTALILRAFSARSEAPTAASLCYSRHL